MSKKHILIRAYGSHLMGMGHLFRMRLVISELKKDSDFKISLLTRNYSESVEIYKFSVIDELHVLPADVSEIDELTYIEQNLEGPFDSILNDQLKTSKAIARALLERSPSVLSIDDTGPGAGYFQHLINVLYANDPPCDREENSFKYLILPDLQEQKSNYQFSSSVTKIFINQGAADTWGAIPDIIHDLNDVEQSVVLRVLLGPAFQHYNELGQALAKTRHRIELFNSTDSVVNLAACCDLAILGAGLTMFEVASIGVPVIGCTREEKELITMKKLLAQKIVVGSEELYENYSLTGIVKVLMAAPDMRKELSNSGRENFCYDGLGRIVKIIREMF